MRLPPFCPWAGMLASFLCFLQGCDAASSRLAPVHGKVSHRGVPLRSGTIVFTPDPLRGTHGPLARAEIQTDGTFVLRTGQSWGAVVGWHRVTIAAVDVPPAPTPGQRYVLPRALVAEKYRDPDLSGLDCEVRAGQDNRIDWNLE